MDAGEGSSDGVPATGRIPEVAAKATVILLYILALTAATLRTAIRYHYRKLQWLDDGFLVAALVFMTIGLGLFFAMVDDLYVTEGLIYDPIDTLEAIGFDDIETIAVRVQIYTLTYNIICISGIFSIKFSFLLFFRNILSRLRCLTLYWRGVVVYAACTWAISLGFTAYGCPYTDARAETCGQGASLWKAIDASVVLIVFDISTDILIISIPIFILKDLIVPLQKKVLLAGSLCLSAVMVVVSILQVATLTYMGVAAIDVVWEIYFQFVELTVAVMVVSMTAFRAFFVQRGSRNQDSPRTPSSWSSSGRYRRAIKKVWQSNSTEESSRYDHTQLDALPSPEITGVRTIIGRGDEFPDPPAPPEPQPETDEPKFHTDAWSPNQDMRPRTEGVTNTAESVPDVTEEYHEIRKKMTGAQAMAAADALDNRFRDIDLEASPFGGHRVTPISSSNSLAASGAEPNIATPLSPISPILERRDQNRFDFPQTNLRRKLAPRYEALSPGPDAQMRNKVPLPPPPPAARATEHRIEPEPSPSRSASASKRVAHIASQHLKPPRSDPPRKSQDSSNHPEPSPASGEAALRRALRRSTDEPEMRESGLKRAISASIARASDFRPPREEEEASTGNEAK